VAVQLFGDLAGRSCPIGEAAVIVDQSKARSLDACRFRPPVPVEDPRSTVSNTLPVPQANVSGRRESRPVAQPEDARTALQFLDPHGLAVAGRADAVESHPTNARIVGLASLEPEGEERKTHEIEMLANLVLVGRVVDVAPAPAAQVAGDRTIGIAGPGRLRFHPLKLGRVPEHELPPVQPVDLGPLERSHTHRLNLRPVFVVGSPYLVQLVQRAILQLEPVAVPRRRMWAIAVKIGSGGSVNRCRG